MVKCVGPEQAPVEPDLSIWGAGGDQPAMGAEVIVVRLGRLGVSEIKLE